MHTLPQFTLDFNRQIKLSNNGEYFPSDTGEFFFKEFDEKLGFSETLPQHLKLKNNRLYYYHSSENLLPQKLYQVIAGYTEDDATDQLTKDLCLPKSLEQMR